MGRKVGGWVGELVSRGKGCQWGGRWVRRMVDRSLGQWIGWVGLTVAELHRDD